MKKILLFVVLLATVAFAERTRHWRQADAADFEKGVAERVSVSSDGKLTLAPKLAELFDAGSSYLWDIVLADDGTLYAAAGPEAKVFKLTGDGEAETIFENEAVEVHALALGPDGDLFAATSPEAKVYRIDQDGESSLFYDPESTYVWDMVFGPDGALYVATGDQGEIHRVQPAGDGPGDGSVFFQTGETHVRSMAFDGQGRLICGTDPGGLILRIDGSQNPPTGFVLHQAGKKEITSVAVGQDGRIYAAGAGIRTATPPARTTVTSTPAPTQTSTPAQALPGAGGPQAAAPATPAVPASLTQVRGGSAIVQIDVDGEPRTIWSDASDVVYSLGFDADGRLLAATGGRGRIIRVDSEDVSTVVTALLSNEVTALALASDGTVYAAASNIGQVVSLGPGLEGEGTFTSEVLDARLFAEFGRLEHEGSGDITVTARSGNLNRPVRNWSDWSTSELPGARYGQWRAVLRAGDEAPVLESATLYYRPKNLAPRVEIAETTPAGYRFPPRVTRSGPRTVTLPALGSRTTNRQGSTPTPPQTMTAAQGFQGVRWKATDPNRDRMRYSVEIQSVGGSAWILLDEELTDSQFSFDANRFADGRYRLRITADDSASNPADGSLTGARETEPFLIDNSQPEISGLTAAAENGRLRVRFSAADSASKIVRAEASVDGAEWQRILPESGIFDSEQAAFDVLLDEGASVAVRVWDERDNSTVAKTLR